MIKSEKKGAYYCVHCSLAYPGTKEYQDCPVHLTPSRWDSSRSPDEIDDSVKILRVEIGEDEHGRLWILSRDLNDRGMHDRLAAEEVVQIPTPEPPESNHPGDDLYAVVGYVDALRAYWIEPLRVPDCVPRNLLRH